MSRGLVQPFDTSLLPSFSELNPYLVKQGQINGQQYMIPWDWGYASVLYRTDKIDPADATGWELFWNKKYSGKISVWNGSASNLEYTALLLGFPQMDNMSSDQISQAKQKLIEQKPLNKFYWSSEYGAGGMQPAFKSGDIWITYSWQDAFVSMQNAGLKVAYMNPSQGRLSWFCGFMLGKDTKNYYHAHKYVESFINQKACAQMTNLYYYGTSNTKVLVSTSRISRSRSRSTWATRWRSPRRTSTCRAGRRAGRSTSSRGPRSRPPDRPTRGGKDGREPGRHRRPPAAVPAWVGVALAAAGRLRAGAARRPDRPDRAVQLQRSRRTSRSSRRRSRPPTGRTSCRRAPTRSGISSSRRW